MKLFIIRGLPGSGKTFEREKNKTFLQKPTKNNVSFCSPSCRGIWSRKEQLGRLTDEDYSRLGSVVVSEFYK